MTRMPRVTMTKGHDVPRQHMAAKSLVKFRIVVGPNMRAARYARRACRAGTRAAKEARDAQRPEVVQRHINSGTSCSSTEDLLKATTLLGQEISGEAAVLLADQQRTACVRSAAEMRRQQEQKQQQQVRATATTAPPTARATATATAATATAATTAMTTATTTATAKQGHGSQVPTGRSTF